MDLAISYLSSCWWTLAQMAPALLAGFLAAGAIAAFISESFIKRHLGGKGLMPIAKSALLGVPMPLCSCGVLPVAAALKRSGASRGALVAFLISVPQTGADNILVVWSLLGLAFAIYSPISAFLSGLFGGAVCEYFGGDKEASGHEEASLGIEKPAKSLSSILKYSFGPIVDDIAGAILLGVAIAGILSLAIPDGWISAHLGPGAGSMLLMLLIGIPIYVCSSGSVPIAAAFVAKGASPGAALVFLITGPASNAAGISAIAKMLGIRTAALFVASLVVFAFASGLLMNFLFGFLPQSLVQAPAHVHGEGSGLLQNICGIALLALLLFSFVKGFFKAKPKAKEGSIVLKIDGMSCKHCQNAVAEALSKLPGTAKVEVDLKGGLAYLEPSDPAHPPAIDDAVKAVESLGFKCKGL